MDWKCERCGSGLVEFGAKVDVFVKIDPVAKRIEKVLVYDEGGLDWTGYRCCGGCGGENLPSEAAVCAAQEIRDSGETDWPCWTVGNC